VNDITITVVSSAITGVLGFAAHHLWARFQNRLVQIPYSVFHQYVGSSADDAVFGSVEIFHNKNKVNSLWLSTITLENTSNKDLESLKIVLYCDTDSLLLVSSARKKGEVSDIAFDKDFVEKTSSGNEHIHFLRREYRIPVLNRREHVEFQMLVTNLKGKRPGAWAGCERAGVRLQEVRLVPTLWGEARDKAAIVGSVLALIATYPLSKLLGHTYPAAAIFSAALLGAVCMVPGVVVLKAWRFFRRLF
jgi:hypothetical protein